jgi:ABC-type transport system involved in multi-copper enzyme maturation permease subunit
VIWIAWRYQRSVAIALALLALVVIGFTIVTGIIQHHYLIEYTGAPCHGSELTTLARGDYCGKLDSRYSQTVNFDIYIKVAGYAIAPVVGAILGLLALASELDQRTARLPWTQSISRSRWLAAKVAVGAASVAIILIPTAVVFSWWYGAIGDSDVLARQNFGIAGWDLVAYGLFMFALTILLGVVIRRVGWTLAAAVLLFLVVDVVFPSSVREHLVTPTIHPYSIGVTFSNGTVESHSEPYPANAWLLVEGIAPRSTVGIPTWNEISRADMNVERCMSKSPRSTHNEVVSVQSHCYKTLHVENVSAYISSNEFWTLQLREGLLYLAFGIILLGGTWAYVRRIEP